jgi:hypothetical protein
MQGPDFSKIALELCDLEGMEKADTKMCETACGGLGGSGILKKSPRAVASGETSQAKTKKVSQLA